jgi:hypothetical protein
MSGRSAGLVDPVEQVAGADDVGGEPLVDRRVERHVAGAVHDRVEVGGQAGTSARSPSHHRDPVGQQPVDTARGLHDLGEHGLLQQLPDPLSPGDRPLGADQHRQADAGTSLSSRCSSASPTKPVTPVRSTC